MEFLGGRWRILAAAREVGVSRTDSNSWSRGYKTYRNGAPWDSYLSWSGWRYVRSALGFCQDELIEIADLRDAGLSIRAIAGRLVGRSLNRKSL